MSGGPAMSTDAAATGPTAPPSALVGWAMFDWAGQPFYTLVQTFLFAPYFANVVVADPMRGQAAWGYAAAFAGAIVAIGSPILGAVADSGGRRKPWVALFGLMLVVGLCTLWLATPKLEGPDFLPGPRRLCAGLCRRRIRRRLQQRDHADAGPLRSARSPLRHRLGPRLRGRPHSLAHRRRLHRHRSRRAASPCSGCQPILPLDSAAREGDRLVGPFSALWFIDLRDPVLPVRAGSSNRRARRRLGDPDPRCAGLPLEDRPQPAERPQHPVDADRADALLRRARGDLRIRRHLRRIRVRLAHLRSRPVRHHSRGDRRGRRRHRRPARRPHRRQDGDRGVHRRSC